MGSLGKQGVEGCCMSHAWKIALGYEEWEEERG